MQERMPVLREEKKKTRSSGKLLFFLLLLFVTLLAVLFFRSSLSKIAQIDIEGNSVLSAEEIGQAAGVVSGDNYFVVRPSAVEARVKQLPAVENVTVRKTFPGALRITVQEYPRVAFQIRPDGTKEMLLANALAVPVKDNVVVDKPILSGWDDGNVWKAKLCETLRGISEKMLAEISEIKPSPTPTYEDKIKMYTRTQFEVYTTVTYLPDKIQYLDEMIEQMADKSVDSGVFELLEANTHIPFDQYYGTQQSSKTDTGDAPKKSN